MTSAPLFDSSLVRLSLLAVGGVVAIKSAAAHLPPVVTLHAWAWAIGLGCVLLALDKYFFYPYLRHPLRNQDNIIRLGPASLLRERPRGSGLLRLLKARHETNLVLTRTITNAIFVVPVGPEALRDVLATNSYDFEKPAGLRAFLARAIGWGVLLAEGDEHKRQRRALNPAFNVRNIRALYPLMWAKSAIFVRQMAAEFARHGVVDVQDWASKLTLDIICPAALSRDVDSLRSDDPTARKLNDSFTALLDPSAEALVYLFLHIWLPPRIIDLLPLRTAAIWAESHKTLHAVCRDILTEKKALHESEKGAHNETDIMSNMIASGEFDDENLIAQMLVSLGAGHETTAGSITFATYMLAQHPHMQDKLRAEIRAHVPSLDSEDAVSHTTFESLPYLNGVCEEVLRLLPSVPATVRFAKRDTTIAGLPVPRGTGVPLITYAINRNPAFWGDDADEFRPERWIDTDDAGVAYPNKHGGAPSNYNTNSFIHGPRACIGRDFAKAEFRCALAALYGRFKVARRFPDEEIELAGTVTLKSPTGMKMVLEHVPGW